MHYIEDFERKQLPSEWKQISFWSMLASIMNQEAAETARESLELVFRMSNILETGLDRHTLSVLIALCDIGLNPEALATLVKELRRDSATTTTTVD